MPVQLDQLPRGVWLADRYSAEGINVGGIRRWES